ncbi:MAG: EpsG family protein [Candidatus Nanosyncoccaceae bacterium]|jgi:hypothetical protein
MSLGVVGSISFYLLVFGLSAWMANKGYHNKNRVLISIAIFIPALIGGLRYDVGLDYFSYLNAYADINNPISEARYTRTSRMGVAFKGIALLSGRIFSSPVPMFFLYSFITIFFFYKILKEAKVSRVDIPLFVFYAIIFLNSFNITRQGVALSVGGLCLLYFAKKEHKKALACGVLAVLFHTSALIIFIYVMLAKILKSLGKRVVGSKKLYDRILQSLLFIILVIIFGSVCISGFREGIYLITGKIGALSSDVPLGVIFKLMLSVVTLILIRQVWENLVQWKKRMVIVFVIGVAVYSLGLAHNEAARWGLYAFSLTPLIFMFVYDSVGVITINQRVKYKIMAIFLAIMYTTSVHFGGEFVRYEYKSILTSPDYPRVINDLNIKE